MLYNNLLLFLVAIFLFSMDTIPDEPLFSGWYALPIFVLTLVAYDLIARVMYARPAASNASGYFATEKRLSILAIITYAGGVLFLADAKYYLAVLSFGNRLPALVNIAGLLLFLLLLAIMWRAALPSYQRIFDRRYSPGAFILANLKANLPIVLPWVILSLCYDLLGQLPFAGVKSLLSSQWGDLVFFGLFLVFVLLFFPPMVRSLWGCIPLPDGTVKQALTAFCRRQNFSAKLYLWPLFEGKVITAGVMGIIPGLRYVLLTPAILQTMTMEELESVMAHEIGHVKRHHLLLYVVLIAGFSLLVGLLAEPLFYFLLSRQFFVELITANGILPATAMSILGGVSLLVAMIVYFRFLFGYFIRNFERQADLHVIRAVGGGRALVSAFEKLAVMGGNIREEKNWHHFGIGERIDCLIRAERDPSTIDRHDRKVRNSLMAYVAVVALAALFVNFLPTQKFIERYEEQNAELLLLNQASQEPEKALWQRMIGDLMMTRKMEKKALAAYQKAFSLEPANPEVMNNLSWLLLTSEDLAIRDPMKALTLARAAAILAPKGYILDTLATAYWANGLVDEAVRTERQAAFADPERHRFYEAQALYFRQESYEEAVAGKRAEQQETAKN